MAKFIQKSIKEDVEDSLIRKVFADIAQEL